MVFDCGDLLRDDLGWTSTFFLNEQDQFRIFCISFRLAGGARAGKSIRYVAARGETSPDSGSGLL